MSIKLRHYGRADDYERIGRFLVTSGTPANRDLNWLRSRWDYMHTHPALDRATLSRIGIWEADGEIVAVANHEDRPGTVYCHFAPAHRATLAAATIEYAEQHLRGVDAGGVEYLRVYAHTEDDALNEALMARGFEHDGKSDATATMTLEGPESIPEAPLPAGFSLFSLAEQDDLVKVHRVMWRGFNHAGEPPAEGLIDRALMQSGPHFRHDLTMIVVAPDGNYASLAGHWYEPVNRTAMVEPVATDPTYRRLGLGRAAVLAGLRRCAAEGATKAYVGSEQQFYYAIGFAPGYRYLRWSKSFK